MKITGRQAVRILRDFLGLMIVSFLVAGVVDFLFDHRLTFTWHNVVLSFGVALGVELQWRFRKSGLPVKSNG